LNTFQHPNPAGRMAQVCCRRGREVETGYMVKAKRESDT